MSFRKSSALWAHAPAGNFDLSDFDDYLGLVRRLGTGGINRSENDLSSNLKSALTCFGLHSLFDTASGNSRTKRPDVALYVDRDAADVGSAADVIIESKKPLELAQFPSLLDALIHDQLWHDKFVPYVTAHAERIEFFILTTFERFLIVPISNEFRSEIQNLEAFPDEATRRVPLRAAISFDIRLADEERKFAAWCAGYLTPSGLSPPNFSAISDIRLIQNAEALEGFASDLADIVVGPEGRGNAPGALIHTIRREGDRLDQLAPEVQRALTVYTMAANGGMSVEAAQRYIANHWQAEWAEFVGASVNSLIGRLFAIKAIEDQFCVDAHPPLIPREAWIFHADRFDQTETARLPQAFFQAMAGLSAVENPAVKDLAATGRFYDWLAPEIDAAAFKRLLAIFFSHSFTDLDEDLLGRFFEIYAQRVDRRRRKQLGQYYTPLPIVRHMWRLAMGIARERGVVSDLFVLDPGVGSGTFLIEGANQLHHASVPRFWERLVGFDISPQAIGVAQINLYLAVLAHLDRNEAEAVGTLHLYPTDALDPRNGERLRTIMPLLADESTRVFLRSRIDLSEGVKRQSRFPLIIGNPPYRNNSDQTLAQIAERFPALLRSSRANARARQRNIRDDYAWFFAAADHYLTNQGLISFVVSDSFCYATSYRFFREDLLRRYHIRHLIILGANVFRDVGPRTQFAIVVLERRAEELPRADAAEPIPVVDLRPLVAGTEVTLASSDDPRLIALDTGLLPPPQLHTPTQVRSFTLFPASEVVGQVESFPNVLHGASARRVFIKKWPGIITAFDELFRADSCDEVCNKARQFFAAAALEGPARDRALDDFAATIRATSDKNRGRLSLMATHAADGNIRFDFRRARRVITGSAPNEVAWYPDERLRSWVYYEPRLRIPRNVHEGRNPGYGTMSQWRDAESHTIDPKFVFTTGTNPDYGLKALVVPGDWMVKLHGGESQQFHYTGLVNPLAQPSLGGPNNLGDDALLFYSALSTRGFGPDDFLFYLGGIYNSQVSEDYLQGGGASVLRIPLVLADVEEDRAGRVIRIGRQLRNLHWLSAEINETMASDLAESLTDRETLLSLGIQELPASGGRFRQRRSWQGTDATAGLIDEAIGLQRQQLDDAVSDLFRSPGPTAAF